jgi:hypothetical protein
MNNTFGSLSNFFLSLDEAKEALRYSNSYTRLPILLSLAYRINETDWLRLLGEQWSGCDNISEYLDDLFDTPFGMRLGEGAISEMMTTEEQARFDSLPDSVTVYRGCYKPNKWGLSWTLSLDVAAHFPTLNRYRMEGKPLLIKALATKEKIAALKHDRDEDEIIIYRPKHVSTQYIRHEKCDM